jgi:hypothetical protein
VDDVWSALEIKLTEPGPGDEEALLASIMAARDQIGQLKGTDEYTHTHIIEGGSNIFAHAHAMCYHSITNNTLITGPVAIRNEFSASFMRKALDTLARGLFRSVRAGLQREATVEATLARSRPFHVPSPFSFFFTHTHTYTHTHTHTNT